MVQVAKPLTYNHVRQFLIQRLAPTNPTKYWRETDSEQVP